MENVFNNKPWYVKFILNLLACFAFIQVKLLAGGSIFGQESYPVKLTIVDGYLQISECGEKQTSLFFCKIRRHSTDIRDL